MVSMIDKNIRLLIQSEIRDILAKPSLDLNQMRKPDGSWITDVDHELTLRVERLLSKTFPGIKIVSEEGSHELSYPCLILEPVDGTAGLVAGNGECSLSLAFMPNANFKDPDASGYIAHLFSDFEVYQGMSNETNNSTQYDGLVSRSEWRKGLYENAIIKKSRSIEPMGSIALKLAHLVNRNAKFVVTLKPKSIWDIAAGTILYHQNGGSFFVDGKQQEELNQLLWTKPMLWGSKEDWNWLTGEL